MAWLGSYNIVHYGWSFTHWGRVTHICMGKLAIISSNNGLSPVRHQAIILTNARMLFIEPLGTNFSEIVIEIHTFSFKKMHMKMWKIAGILSRSQCVNYLFQKFISTMSVSGCVTTVTALFKYLMSVFGNNEYVLLSNIKTSWRTLMLSWTSTRCFLYSASTLHPNVADSFTTVSDRPWRHNMRYCGPRVYLYMFPYGS